MRYGASGKTVVFLILAIALLSAVLFLVQSDLRLHSPDALSHWMAALGGWAPAAVIALMILHSFVPFPAELLAVAAGAIFGTLLGAALIWLGAMLGAFTAFWLARYLGQEIIRNWLTAQHRSRLDQWTEESGALVLLISRLIPLIAFNLINYAAGLSRVSSWTFAWTTGLGILPVTLLSTYLGAQMRHLDWPQLLLLSAAAIGLVLLGNWLWQRHQG